MKLFDLFYLSFKNFQSRKSRIIFTILSVAVGIGAILFLVSLGFGLQKNLLEKITTQESLLTLDILPAEAKIIALTPATLKEISQISGVEKISPQAIFPSQVSSREITSELTLNLINADWFSLSGVLPTLGRTFEQREAQKAVINSPVAGLFNLTPEQTLGKKLKFNLFLQESEDSAEVKVFPKSEEFEIVGVLEEQGASPQVYLQQDDFKDLPIKEFQFAKVKVRQSEEMEQVREKLLSLGFLVSALSDTVDQANKIFKVIQVVLGIFGVVALIVAAIGLVNTMTITLLERTNEIGIMRAIGASPKDIKRLFLGESTLTGFLGGLGGIVIGIVVSQGFNGLVNILAKALGGRAINLFAYPFWFILFIILLSIIVGLVAGFWPARRAAKLNPLDALRYK